MPLAGDLSIYHTWLVVLSVGFGSVSVPSLSVVAWMAVTALHRTLIPSRSFWVPGRGFRFDGWNPASPAVSTTKRATVISGR